MVLSFNDTLMTLENKLPAQFIHCANHGELTRSSSEENANYWSVNCSLKEISSLEQMNYSASVSGKIEENLKWMITAFSNICLMYDQSKLDGISF